MRIVSDLRVTNMYIHVDLTMNNTTTHTTSNSHTHTDRQMSLVYEKTRTIGEKKFTTDAKS